MGLGAGTSKKVHGAALASVRITDNKTGRVVDEKSSATKLLPPVPIDSPHARVGAEVHTSMCHSYQTVAIRAWCELPCAPDIASRQAAFAEAMRFVDECLADSAEYARDTLNTLVEAKQAHEGGR